MYRYQIHFEYNAIKYLITSFAAKSLALSYVKDNELKVFDNFLSKYLDV